MKLPTDEPSDQVMRFFTRELYLQYNSADDKVADRANDAWEQALADYRQHLDAIRDEMPSPVRKVADLCLHDAEVLGFEQETVPEPSWPGPFWSAVAIFTLKQDDCLRTIIYLLGDQVREYAAPTSWKFSATAKHWLYDEIDRAPGLRTGFLHRILFSDGCIAEIPFASAIVCSAKLPKSEAGGAAKRIA